MKYINADKIFPEYLVEQLQTYLQGGYIYIPLKKENHKQWGETTGYRQEISSRNQAIKLAFSSGQTIENLAEEYCLSIYTIKKIIYHKTKSR